MKKRSHDDDFELQEMDKAKILVSVIPVVLIVIILSITLVMDGNKKDKAGADDVQQSMMDYADEINPVDSTQVSMDEEPEATPKKEIAKEKKEEESQDSETADEEINMPSPTPYRQVMDTEKMDYSKVTYNKEEQLKEMMTYWADNNQKALDDLANLDRFKAMSWALKNTKDYYYYGDKNASGLPEGKGIAVYADNQYYYGDWKNGVRSGGGTWMHYHIHNATNNKDIYLYHQYAGLWADDLPEGEGSEHYDYDMDLLKENAYYYTNLIGSYSKGLVNGEFYLTSIDANDNFKEWYGDADHGSWLYKSENKDKVGRRTVHVSTSDPDNYIWMSPKENKDIGIPCLISVKN